MLEPLLNYYCMLQFTTFCGLSQTKMHYYLLVPVGHICCPSAPSFRPREPFWRTNWCRCTARADRSTQSAWCVRARCAVIVVVVGVPGMPGKDFVLIACLVPFRRARFGPVYFLIRTLKTNNHNPSGILSVPLSTYSSIPYQSIGGPWHYQHTNLPRGRTNDLQTGTQNVGCSGCMMTQVGTTETPRIGHQSPKCCKNCSLDPYSTHCATTHIYTCLSV